MWSRRRSETDGAVLARARPSSILRDEFLYLLLHSAVLG